LKNANPTNVCLVPPKPNINRTEEGSEWIFIKWTIDEIAYIDSFDIFSDSSFLGNLSKQNFTLNETSFSYNCTEDIEPFSQQVKFNYSYSSKYIFILF